MKTTLSPISPTVSSAIQKHLLAHYSVKHYKLSFFSLLSLMFMDPETQARYAHNGKAMLGSAILLFLIILIIIFLHPYRYSCFRRRRHRTQTNSTSAFNKALPLSLFNFLPTFTYSSATHRPLHDCAVCLSEFADGVEGRILPNCNHAFHSHCIDAWFRSHSNCPLCRTPVHQHAAPVQPPPTASSDIGPGRMGCSSLPAPIWCPRKPLEVVGIKLELEDKRLRGPEPDSGPVLGYHGFEGSDNRIPSLKRF